MVAENFYENGTPSAPIHQDSVTIVVNVTIAHRV